MCNRVIDHYFLTLSTIHRLLLIDNNGIIWRVSDFFILLALHEWLHKKQCITCWSAKIRRGWSILKHVPQWKHFLLKSTWSRAKHICFSQPHVFFILPQSKIKIYNSLYMAKKWKRKTGIGLTSAEIMKRKHSKTKLQAALFLFEIGLRLV